jgi:hypothetical protein
VKVFRSELEEAIAAALRAPVSLSSSSAPSDPRFNSWDGLYRWELPNSSAELEISSDDQRGISVRGVAFWGTKNLGGPNVGELDAAARADGSQLRIEQGDYLLILRRSQDGIEALESRTQTQFGMNVTFQGAFRRIAAGAEALPQPPLKSFESELWPGEGRPVFRARGGSLSLRARPAIDSPIVASIDMHPGQRINFTGFRHRTVRPGRVIARRSTQIAGRNFGQTDHLSSTSYYNEGRETITVQLKDGAEIEYLQYRAEGSGFVRWQGLVLEIGYLPWLSASDEFEMVASPVSECWLRLHDKGSDVSGWLLADGQLEEARREF